MVIIPRSVLSTSACGGTSAPADSSTSSVAASATASSTPQDATFVALVNASSNLENVADPIASALIAELYPDQAVRPGR